MNNVHHLDTHRKARKSRKHSAWAKDYRVRDIEYLPVRLAVISLLDELQVDPTLLFFGTANTAHYPLKQSLIEDSGLTRASFIDAVQDTLFTITRKTPSHLVLSSPNTEGEISIVYVL